MANDQNRVQVILTVPGPSVRSPAQKALNLVGCLLLIGGELVAVWFLAMAFGFAHDGGNYRDAFGIAACLIIAAAMPGVLLIVLARSIGKGSKSVGYKSCGNSSTNHSAS